MQIWKYPISPGGHLTISIPRVLARYRSEARTALARYGLKSTPMRPRSTAR